MKTFLVSLLLAVTTAFSPEITKRVKTSTQLDLDRRGFCAAALGLLIPSVANAKPASTWFFDEKIEEVYEPAQQATDGRLDLNSAFVVS